MEQYHILKTRTQTCLTRFANSTIHQNIVKDETASKVLYIIDKKIGELSSIGKEPDTNEAKKIAFHSKENLDFVTLPDQEEAGVPEYKASYSSRTATATPRTRAELVKNSLALCEKKGLSAAGYVSTGSNRMDIRNSLGVERNDKTSFASFKITVSGKGTGYATGITYDINMLDIPKLTSQAIKTAIENENPQAIEPGSYPVLLEPLAAYELLVYLAYIGFTGMYYNEGRSCFSSMLGEKVISPLLTIYDEPIADLPGMVIDVEGVARRKTILVDKGVLKNVAYDSYSAHKVGKKSSGHAIGLMSAFGGLPLSMTLVPGKSKPEEMLANITKGLLIKRFWYTRIISWKQGIITGMTRDGTFLVEDGKCSYPVKNLRFQVTLPDVLNQVKEVGNKLKQYEYARSPHLLIDNFTITGMTG